MGLASNAKARRAEEMLRALVADIPEDLRKPRWGVGPRIDEVSTGIDQDDPIISCRDVDNAITAAGLAAFVATMDPAAALALAEHLRALRDPGGEDYEDWVSTVESTATALVDVLLQGEVTS